MFTRSLYQTADITQQGDILRQVATLAEQGNIRTTATTVLNSLTAANLRQAHQMVERGDMIGKVVIAA